MAPRASAQVAASAEGAGRTRFAVEGEAAVNVAPEEPYYFHDTDYDHNALRLVTGALGASFTLAPPLAVIGEVRVENDDGLRVSALYVRLRPWGDRPVAIQAGRIPPVFGAFSRYRYGSDNPLVSLPLPYQYLSTLRSDRVPPDADALLSVRGRGWFVSYGLPPSTAGADAAYYDHGLPLVSTSRWDTGVQVHVNTDALEATAAVTVGSLSRPRVSDDNDGKQLVGRVVWRPTAAWAFGVSAARGEYLGREALGEPGGSPSNVGPWIQRGLGLDVAFSSGHLRVRGEAISSAWRVPVLDSPEIASPLEATSGTLEVLYRLAPAIDVAARADYLTFSDIQGTLHGGHPTTWDADVTRLEIGGSYRLTRQLRLKVVYQHNWRYADERISDGFPAAQLSFWF